MPVSGKKQDLIQRLLDNQAPTEDSPAPAEAEAAVEEQQEQPNEEDVPAPPADSASAPQLVEPTAEVNSVPQEPTAGTTRPREAEPEQAEEQPEPKRVKVDEADSDMVNAAEPAEQQEEAVVEQDQAEEPVVEEEEPPEYHFEPEEEDTNRPTDMYLDTVRSAVLPKSTDMSDPCSLLQINRNVLDFDFERLCSVTLSHNNIYACLTNGKYFQGRGKTSPAYAHSIAEDNHVFINLSTQKVSSFFAFAELANR